jgi:hypothetical protein
MLLKASTVEVSDTTMLSKEPMPVKKYSFLPIIGLKKLQRHRKSAHKNYWKVIQDW